MFHSHIIVLHLKSLLFVCEIEKVNAYNWQSFRYYGGDYDVKFTINRLSAFFSKTIANLVKQNYSASEKLGHVGILDFCAKLGADLFY